MDAIKATIAHMIPQVVILLIIIGTLYALGNTEEVREVILPMVFLVLGSGLEKFARSAEAIPYSGLSGK